MRMLAGSAALLAALLVAGPAVPPAAAAAPHVDKPPRVGLLYAINDRTHRVVRFDLVDGHWLTSRIGHGWHRPTALAVTATGTAWVVDDGRLVRVSGNGRQSRVRAIGDETDLHLAVGPAGTVFYNDRDTLYRVSASGTTVTRIATVRPESGVPVGLGVDRRGRPTIGYIGKPKDFDGVTGEIVLATFPSTGGKPHRRTVLAQSYDDDNGISDFRESPTGTVAMHEWGGIGNGFTGTDLFAQGATEPSYPESGLLLTTFAFDVTGRLVIAEDTKFCYSADDSGCQPDTWVRHLLVYPAKGGSWYRTVPTGNLRLPSELAAAVDGRVFAVDGTQLKTVPPTGGSAYTIMTGRFHHLQVPGRG